MRIVLTIVGLCFVALGAVGVVLPVLPTTPFLLVAAWCFARSSPSLARVLHENRWFGPLLRDWDRYGVVVLPDFGKPVASAKLMHGGQAVRVEKQDFGTVLYVPKSIQDPIDTIIQIETGR